MTEGGFLVGKGREYGASTCRGMEVGPFCVHGVLRGWSGFSVGFIVRQDRQDTKLGRQSGTTAEGWMSMLGSLNIRSLGGFLSRRVIIQHLSGLGFL